MDRKECLQEALRVVSTDRQNDYGTPEKNFEVIARYWSNYLSSVGVVTDVFIRPLDVAAMMCLLKIARIATSPTKEDNWVDLAGYAANGVEVSDDLYRGGIEMVLQVDEDGNTSYVFK